MSREELKQILKEYKHFTDALHRRLYKCIDVNENLKLNATLDGAFFRSALLLYLEHLNELSDDEVRMRVGRNPKRK